MADALKWVANAGPVQSLPLYSRHLKLIETIAEQCLDVKYFIGPFSMILEYPRKLSSRYNARVRE